MVVEKEVGVADVEAKDDPVLNGNEPDVVSEDGAGVDEFVEPNINIPCGPELVAATVVLVLGGPKANAGVDEVELEKLEVKVEAKSYGIFFEKS